MLHLTSTKNRVVTVQKILILENILACHIGPDQSAAAVIVRASLADPSRPSDRYHGTTDTYDNDTKYIQRKPDITRRNTTLLVDVTTHGDYTECAGFRHQSKPMGAESVPKCAVFNRHVRD